MAPRRSDDAVIFLTHFWSPRIARHFKRLKREASPVLPVFLAYSLRSDDDTVPPEVPANFAVSRRDGHRLMPRRMIERAARGDLYGYIDTMLMPILRTEKARRYRYIWLVEYDVDFAGDWGSFFAGVTTCEADLLATEIRSRSEHPNWYNWPGFSGPASFGPEEQFAAFCPIVRFSQRFLEAYCRDVESGAWTGHFEALYPSIAYSNGLKLADLGGGGRFVPAGWEWRHYMGERHPSVRTFHYRPPVSDRYFHEDRSRFATADRLYHPIKFDREPRTARQKFVRESWRIGRQLMNFVVRSRSVGGRSA